MYDLEKSYAGAFCCGTVWIDLIATLFFVNSPDNASTGFVSFSDVLIFFSHKQTFVIICFLIYYPYKLSRNAKENCKN